MTFASQAARLAGLAGALLGWRPADFWDATPEELATILAVLAPPPACADERTLDRLMERFPDG